MDYLKSRGVQHSAAVVTKMKFDANAAYPKIFFAAERWLEPQELAIVAPLTKSDDVQKLLAGTYTPAGVDGVEKHSTTAPWRSLRRHAQQGPRPPRLPHSPHRLRQRPSPLLRPLRTTMRVVRS
jgi:hypothetical protein